MSHRNRYRAERRRQLTGALVKASLMAGLLGLTSFYSYHVGALVVRDEMAEVAAEIERRRQADGDAAVQAAQMRTALAEARSDAERYRALAQSLQPSAEAAELMRLVQEKLGAGMPRERLAFFIEAAGVQPKCGDVVVRKLAVRVGPKDGEEARFGEAGGALTVSAQGSAEISPRGKPERWFDPARPVTVRFAPAGGRPSEVTGVLPLHHTVLTRNYEQRFSISAGTRGQVTISGDRCEFRSG